MKEEKRLRKPGQENSVAVGMEVVKLNRCGFTFSTIPV
jgi:hypothetical protein